MSTLSGSLKISPMFFTFSALYLLRVPKKLLINVEFREMLLVKFPSPDSFQQPQTRKT